MELSLQKLSKAFNQKTVFKNLNLDIPSGSHLAIQGSNGSGKSTLLKIISGGLLASEGVIRYSLKGKPVSEDRVYQYVHLVAPYNTVIEELTLPELFRLHQKLGCLPEYESYKAWRDQLQYPFHPDHRIKTFSSGMKQRVKLGLTMLDSRPLILLDEPGTNMDAQGKAWLLRLIAGLKPDQTLIMASNEISELALCTSMLNVEDYT
jgi:ABC-type multidrug transport system ATPase subunit